MLLTIDVGNTNTVLGVFEGAELRAHWRLTTRREQTADEYGILVRNLFAGSGLDPARVEAVALASVVPPLTPVLVELARQYLGHEPLVVGPGVKTGMPILYEPPGRRGRRPHRERRGGVRGLRRARDRGGLRHRDHVRRDHAPGRVRRAA